MNPCRNACAQFDLRSIFEEWKSWTDGVLLHGAFGHAPDETEVRVALFARDPVKWNRSILVRARVSGRSQ